MGELHVFYLTFQYLQLQKPEANVHEIKYTITYSKSIRLTNSNLAFHRERVATIFALPKHDRVTLGQLLEGREGSAPHLSD